MTATGAEQQWQAGGGRAIVCWLVVDFLSLLGEVFILVEQKRVFLGFKMTGRRPTSVALQLALLPGIGAPSAAVLDTTRVLDESAAQIFGGE